MIRRIFSFVLALVMVLGLVQIPALAVDASSVSDSNDENVLFQDDFSSDSGEWTVESGTWAVSDGTYNQTSASGAAMTFAGSSEWTDYEVEVTFTPVATSKSLAVMVSGRANDSKNRYIGAYNGGKLMIDRRINGSSTVLASKTFTMELNKTYTMKLVFSGSSIELYINGTKELEAEDSTYASGGIGLATYNTSVSFDNVTVRSVEAPAAVFTVNEPSNYQVIQRDVSSKNAQLTLNGNATGDGVAAVQARVMNYADESTADSVVPWTDMTLESGAYTGSVTVPQGGWYRLEIQSLDAEGAVLETIVGTNKWGVGINILCAGQSNMVGQGEKPYTVANDLVANCKSGVWSHLEDPYSGAGGSLVPAMANKLVEELGLPIGIIPAGVSGTGLVKAHSNHSAERYWMNYNSENPADTTTLYGQAITKAGYAGGVELLVWNQGETDGYMGVTEEEYENAMETLLERFRTDLDNSELPMFLCQIGTHDETNFDDAIYTGIRNAQHDLDDGENFYLAATEMEFERKDTAHYKMAGMNEIGKRVANAILYYYGESDYYRGPYISSANYNDDSGKVINVKVAHRGGTDISTTGQITGFSVLDDGTEVEVTSAVRINSSTIQLTLASAITGSASVRYLYGLNPNVSNIAKDNTAMALPLENTTEPIEVSDEVVPEVSDKTTEDVVWDILDHDFAPTWNSEGIRSSTKVGTITQGDEYVNISKSNSENVGSTSLYHWVISPSGLALPRDGFTMETTVRVAGEVENEANEISIRMGENSNDLNGQIASVFLGYGENGYISANGNGTGPYYMELDTTVWHNITYVVFQQDDSYYYDLYVDGKLAFDTVPFTTYKGGDLVRFGADNTGRCNLDVKNVRLGSGMILPEGASSARITGISLSAESQKETEEQTVTVTLEAPDFVDGREVTVELLDKSFESVANVTSSGTFLDGEANVDLTIPSGLAASIYYVKAVSDGRTITSSAYQVTVDREAPDFPTFTATGFTIEMEDYIYNPTEEFNFPTVVDTKDHPVENSLGDYRYYLFYAPHDAPAGCCVAVSNSLNGPWIEYANNPVVSKVWTSEDGTGNSYSVSHVSSPWVIWNDVYDCWFMYFHGENNVTRYATSDDLINWTYGDVCVVANDFSPSGTGFSEASYARVYEHEVPGLGNKYIMVLMVTGTGLGMHRNIYWAHSEDGKEWTAVQTSLLDPTVDSEYKGNFSGPWFMEWDGRYYVICHASSGDMYAFEVGESLNEAIAWGTFYDSNDSLTSNAEDESAYPDYGRSGAPCFIQDDDGDWHMFYEGGRRLHANIVHAVAHNYEAVVTPATCTEDGYTTYTCNCGESYVDDVVSAPGHSYEDQGVAPTCESAGYTLHQCGECPYNYRDNWVTALGHQYQSIVTEPTCDTMGYTTHTCPECDDTYIDSYTQALDHDYVAKVTLEATCTDEGEMTFTCQHEDCDASYTMDIPLADHDCEETIVQATCSAAGYARYECKDCDYEYVAKLTQITCPSAVFSDVGQAAWYHEAVDYAITEGLMKGVADDLFAPNGTVTRAQLVTVLYRASGSPSVDGLDNPFADVPADTWYTNAVIWAFNSGVVKGVSDTAYAPGDAITREQLVTMLYRYTQMLNSDVEVPSTATLEIFDDADKVSAYAEDAVAWAVENGIICGIADNGQDLLMPAGSATRAQMATIFMRYQTQ